MTRILHLRSSCGLYGADRLVLALAAATRPLTAVVGNLVRGDEDPLGPEAARMGLDHWRVQCDARVDLRAARALADRIASERIGLIHAHDYKSLALGAIAARSARIPLVATYHGDTAATPMLVLYEGLARVLGNLTSGVAAVSAPLAETLSSWIWWNRVLHIPNGIPIPPPCSAEERAAARAALGLGPSERVIAVVGRLSPEKGHRVLFDAVQAGPPMDRILIAGDGPLKAELMQRAHRLPARWLGFVGDTRSVYAAADLIAIPSLTEGVPLVALEAMAAGRPVVASAVGDLPRVLHGAGMLVPASDPAALRAALNEVLGNADTAATIAARGRQRVVAEYSVERMAARYAEALYAPALGQDWAMGTGIEGAR